MQPSGAVATDIVLLGAGAAHLEVLRRFARRREPGVRLTLVVPEPEAPCPGLLPALIRGDRPASDASIDLVLLTAAAGARLILAEAVGIDLAGRTLELAGRPPMPFDLLSADLAGESAMPEAQDACIPVSPPDRFPDRLSALEAALPDGARLALIGGGASATELALALARRFRGRLRLTLVSEAPEPLAAAPPLARRAVRAALVDAGVELASAVHAGALIDGRLALSDGSFLPVDAVLWAGGTRAPDLLAEAGLACDAAGRVLVGADQGSVSHAGVFAAGDCAAHSHRQQADRWAGPALAQSAGRSVGPALAQSAGRSAGPALAQSADRWTGPPLDQPADPGAGRLLAANLRRAAQGRKPSNFPHQWRPPQFAPAMLDLGGGRAVAWSHGLAVSGEAVGHGKDWRDRCRMRAYAPRTAPPRTASPHSTSAHSAPPHLAPPHSASPHSAPPRAAARAASAPPAAMFAALSRMAAPDSLVGVGTSDHTAVLTPPFGQALVQSVTCLRSCLDDPFVFGQIAAAHALSEQYAIGARPWTALAIATGPAGSKMWTELGDMLAGAADVLGADGCSLVGGHHAEAAETSLGFAISGLAEPSRLLRKAGLRAGDALLLTKPLGSGIVLAGHARGEARAAWLRAAIGAMRASNAAASRVLRAHGASACAAINGAGLAGHLGEMLAASQVAAVLWPEAVPVLPGALELLAPDGAGRRGLPVLPNRVPPAGALPVLAGAGADARAALLAEPEISGGLLAGIAPARAEACLAALHGAGLHAAAVGVVEAAVQGAPMFRLAQG